MQLVTYIQSFIIQKTVRRCITGCEYITDTVISFENNSICADVVGGIQLSKLFYEVYTEPLCRSSG